MKSLRNKNPSNVILSYLNINSIRNKFDHLKEFCNSVDVLAVAETKINQSFPKAQFLISGFHEPYRLDITDKSGGILVFVRLNSFALPTDIQILPFELNLRKEKWLVVAIYRPPKQNCSYFLDWLT